MDRGWGISNAKLAAQPHITALVGLFDQRHHRHPYSDLLKGRPMASKTFAQPMLNRNVPGLISVQFHQHQLEIFDAATVIDDELDPVIAAIDGSPEE